MTTPQPVRGTQSLLGEEADRFVAVIEAFDKVRRLFGFQRVEVPVLENAEVFARTMGETTDVVSKEMYDFRDKGGEWVAMRPEFTAGICRAYLSEGWQQYAPLKAATHGPAFRYERPQKGRFRQFHQLDAEIIGNGNPAADIELVSFADQLLDELGITTGVTLQLNTLGDPESRRAWRAQLIKYFEDHRSALSEDCQQRLDRNPLRILDSKDPRDQAIAANAPMIDDYLSTQAQEVFQEVAEGLEFARIQFTRNPCLVRGLDYYRHTIFEFVTDRLGAQGAVIAGGRYDGLIEALGGPHTPAVGWAAGIERLTMLLGRDFKPQRTAAVVVESDLAAVENIGKLLVQAMRKGEMAAQLVADGSIKKRFDKAVKMGADYILILETGQSEDAAARLRLKRRIADRYGTKGRIYVSLKPVLKNLFGVSEQDWKRTARRGGELTLKSKK